MAGGIDIETEKNRKKSLNIIVEIWMVQITC